MVSGQRLLSRRNIAALDGLRGLAILAVMCAHAPAPAARGVLKQIVRLGFTHGWAGVDLFFVLSGLLITGILLDSRECTNYFVSFYSRRALRIFPLYYSFLLLAWLVFPAAVSSDWLPLKSDWWLYPTYLMNWQVLWKDVWHANIVGHFWSLAVEEQFYFLWPLVVLTLRPRYLLWSLVCLEIVMAAGRAWWVAQYGVSTFLWAATITRMDGLLFGAACAVAVREFRFPRWVVVAMPWFSACCLAVFLAAVRYLGPGRDEEFSLSVGLVLLAGAFATIAVYAVLADSDRTRVQNWLRWKPLTQVGKYAYGMYVFHVPLFYFVNRGAEWLPEATPLNASWMRYFKLGFEFLITFALASFSYRYFEKRFLALKYRFEPKYPTPDQISRPDLSSEPPLPKTVSAGGD
jgi:peptidoglycan/LPS O-acetylase OafA/YrhL